MYTKFRSVFFYNLYSQSLINNSFLTNTCFFLMSISFLLLLPFPHHHFTHQVCVWNRNWWHRIHRWWWCGCPHPGCSQIVISLCCATWRRWAVGWSTVPRPYSTVSTSSGPSRSWRAMGCLFLTPSPTVNWFFFFFGVVDVVVIAPRSCSVLLPDYNQPVRQWMCDARILVIYLHPSVWKTIRALSWMILACGPILHLLDILYCVRSGLSIM